MGKAPVQPGERVGLHQRLQELDAGVVGEVQIINDHGPQFACHGVAERGVDRALQQQPLGFAGQRHGVPQLRQQVYSSSHHTCSIPSAARSVRHSDWLVTLRSASIIGWYGDAYSSSRARPISGRR